MPAGPRLLERVRQDLAVDAADLDVHLQRGDARARARDLEVHVAVVVLDAGDVGQDRVLVAFLDQAHGHARPRAP